MPQLIGVGLPTFGKWNNLTSPQFNYKSVSADNIYETEGPKKVEAAKPKPSGPHLNEPPKDQAISEGTRLKR